MKKPIIEFSHFGFKYRSQEEPTLSGIDLTIYEGEKILIVGPSGSGKSTLGHCLNGLIPFSYKGEVTGSLKIAEKDTKKQGIFELSKKVGTVLQDPDRQFIGLTVGEDIAFSLENDMVPQQDMKERVKAVAKMVEMEDHLHSSLHQLSGGQKQRVALGGVMIDDVDILLFDEPLANLDPATGKYAIELIDRIHREMNKTIVIIEHRLEDVLYRHVDRIIVVYDGKIVADLPPSDLLATNILEECDIREPLYIRALKYAGCHITPQSHPENFSSLPMKEWESQLRDWFEASREKKDPIFDEPVLQLENVNFKYPSSPTIIHDISFAVYKGEMVSIAGNNGAGKSTLTKLICHFEQPNSGTIRINEVDAIRDSIKERSDKVGLVMQNPNHMISKHMIYDEVALGLVLRGVAEAEIRERVEKVLKICGLLPFRNWPISALSFGQKKRVTIASILALNPDILILDEPTAGQDYRHYTEIMEFLTELNQQGVTIIIITHDMHLMLEYTQRVIVISSGEKIADGSTVSALRDEFVIKEANLKETSLFELAERAGIEDVEGFTKRFIHQEKAVGRVWQ